MRTRRRLVLIRHRTEEVVVRHQRFIMNATRLTTYKVTTVCGASGLSRRVSPKSTARFAYLGDRNVTRKCHLRHSWSQDAEFAEDFGEN